MDFDNLNNIQTEYTEESFDIERFIDEMEISDEQKDNRKELAQELSLALMFLFALVREQMNYYGYIDYAILYNRFKGKFEPIVLKYARNDEYIQTYVDKASNDIINTTINRAALDTAIIVGAMQAEESNTDFWLSQERADIVAANEANTILNYEELQEAVDEGKTKKQWVTMHDRRVRHTHRQIDGKTIDIDEFFQVGDVQLMIPRDEVNDWTGGEETANCRCTLRFY